MLQIKTLIVGAIETNCYLVTNPQGQTLIIDPGAEPEKILAALQGLTPLAIINTHGHYDHILANQPLQAALKIPVYYPENDRYLIPIQQQLYAIDNFRPDFYYTNEILIKEFPLVVIPTPGHTKGSTSLFLEQSLFTGDTMFAEGYLGRTDLWGGSPIEINTSLGKLLALDPKITVYSGHGPASTIGEERKYHGR